jgi:chitinase
LSVGRVGTITTGGSATYTAISGTAISGSDFTAATGTVSWVGTDVTPKIITITIINDAISEPAEQFEVRLDSASGGAVLGSDAAKKTTITINDNDTPIPSIANQSAIEGVATGTLNFTVTLSPTSFQTYTVNYASANGTAVAGTDYTGVSGVLTFAPNQGSKTISVPITPDGFYEGDETFTVVLRNPTTNAILGTAIGTITDDDAAPRFSIDDVSVNETATSMIFTVSKTGVTALTHTVNFATAPAATSPATAGSDYTASSGILTFLPGEISKTIVVALANDSNYEGNEVFYVNLNAASGGATIQKTQGIGTIFDDDSPQVPVWSGSTLGCVSVGCGFIGPYPLIWSPSPGADRYEVELSGDLGPYRQIYNGPFTTAVTGDFAGYVVAARLRACNAFGCSGYSAIANFFQDVPPPTFGINDVIVNENAGTMTFTVTKNNYSSQTFTVDYATANGTALAGSDYVAAAGTLSFAAAELSKTITITLLDDSLDEGNESFNVNLSNPSGGASFTDNDNRGVGTVLDDDASTVSAYESYHYGIADHLISLDPNEGPANGYVDQGVKFKLFAAGGAGMAPLYRCFLPPPRGNHYVSRDAGCEVGGAPESTYGYVYASPTNGTVPLYRFIVPSNGDSVATTNYNEGVSFGLNYEGMLGYVLPAN